MPDHHDLQEAGIFKLIGRILSAILTLAVMAGAVLLALGNPERVDVSIWPFAAPFGLPVWLLMVTCFGAGLVIGGLAMWWPLARLRLTARGLRKSLDKAVQDKLTKEKLEKSDDKPALPPSSH